MPSLPGPGPASCSWWAEGRRLGGRGTKGNGAHQGPVEDSGLLGLLAQEKNYLVNKENNSVCSSSCFKEKNCLGKVRKAGEIGVNTPCILLTFQTHQSRQQPETVGLKIKTPRAS